jgi:nitric oxide reductase NorD protein
MTLSGLKERFLELVPPPRPSEWEVEESLDKLRELSPTQQQLVLDQVPVIWPVSNSLCYSYLNFVGPALDCLADDQISDWVAAILDTYEQQGLRQAQLFMADAEDNYLCRLRGEDGVELSALPQLRTYAQGLIGQPIRLAPDRETWTDTETIYLPAKIAAFASPTDNFLYYKLLLTFQAGLIASETLRLTFSSESILIKGLREAYGLGNKSVKILNLAGFFQLFPLPRLAADLFSLAEARRLEIWLAKNFPGLWRDSAPLRQKLFARHPVPSQYASRTAMIEQLSYLVLSSIKEANSEKNNELYRAIEEQLLEVFDAPEDSAIKCAALYALLNGLPETYQEPPVLPWSGRLHAEEAWQVQLRQREATREKFVKELATLLAKSKNSHQPEQPAEELPVAAAKSEGSPTAALLMPPGKNSGESENPVERFLEQELLTLAGTTAEIPDSLRQTLAEIGSDLGQIPPEYISAAQGLAGRGVPASSASSSGEGEGLSAPLLYDEWDFRRHGFRRNWCAVHERSLQPVKSSLVERTLDKYRGQVRILRKQFEMLRSGERFLRRQRDGTDFDLDQVIESLSDRRAGLAGSDQLFIRLCRDERDIAVLFLVDMSSSTEGWINRALQEALILTGEALQTIGDRFAIAGFSGMRRTRTDIYRVKDFTEPYNEQVKGRIAAMAPKEYTRMGPALRHAGKLLGKIEARLRLLIVLSDGKPEDYDDYKGRYAIEDTRHALIEAKAAGIHPFCITIDRQAHEYMPHMYGEVNYIFLDDIRQLPLRLPAIYRTLTT